MARSLVSLILLVCLVVSLLPSGAAGGSVFVTSNSLSVAAPQHHLLSAHPLHLSGMVESQCLVWPTTAASTDLGTTETILLNASSDNAGVSVELQPLIIVFEHDAFGCLQQRALGHSLGVAIRLVEALPAWTTFTIRVEIESDRAVGGPQAVQLMGKVGPEGDLIVQAPATVTIDGNGDGQAKVALRNDYNTALEVRMHPTLRGFIGTQPIVGRFVIEPGEERMVDLVFGTTDGAGTTGVLDIVVYHSFRDAPGHFLLPKLASSIVEIPTTPALLNMGVEEAAAPSLVVPLGILGLAGLVLRRRSS